MPRNFLDTFAIFPTADLSPGGLAEGVFVLGEEAAREAFTAFKRPVTVMRITEGWEARNVTEDFVPEPVEEPDSMEHWTRGHTRRMVNIGSFGRR